MTGATRTPTGRRDNFSRGRNSSPVTCLSNQQVGTCEPCRSGRGPNVSLSNHRAPPSRGNWEDYFSIHTEVKVKSLTGMDLRFPVPSSQDRVSNRHS